MMNEYLVDITLQIPIASDVLSLPCHDRMEQCVTMILWIVKFVFFCLTSIYFENLDALPLRVGTPASTSI